MVKIQLIHGNCLDTLDGVQTGSIDLVLMDPPYGTTACHWDTVIPFSKMWAVLQRVAKKDAAIIIMAAQPFTSKLVCSNIANFKQSLIWSKGKGSNPLLAKKRIMQSHEDICIFCYGTLPYNPQMRVGTPYKAPRTGGNHSNKIVGSPKSGIGFQQEDNMGSRYPISVLNYSIHCGSKLNPTQKPVDLMEYLILTYSSTGDTVLDPTMGSGTTGVACIGVDRNFIGIDSNKEQYDIASTRINESKIHGTGLRYLRLLGDKT